MHELSFAEQVVDCVERETKKYPGHKVVRVKLRVGEFLAIEPSSLRFCLEGISAGTAVEGAEFQIQGAGPEVACAHCGCLPLPSHWDGRCPMCGREAELRPGTELIVEEIELDDQTGSC